jgi:hypothetical protein
MRRLLVVNAVAVGAAAALAAAAVPASAASHSCRSFSARAGGVDHIRVTNGFKCRDVMQTLRPWASAPDRYGPPPWRCRSRQAGLRWRCKLRTSFGGTRPERLYRLRFRFLDE